MPTSTLFVQSAEPKSGFSHTSHPA